MTIAQGFAEHINNHAESLRSQFVKHQGKQELKVAVDCPIQREQWPDIMQQWALQIRDHVGAEMYGVLECSFTTTTPITKTASPIVMMDTFRKYFDYSMYGVCGIPSIIFLGSVEDWQSIYDRVKTIAKYDLDWWTDRLLPICEEFIKTASGQPSLEFWRKIYKPEQIYGGQLINGWLADLFPYIEASHSESAPLLVKNPILAIPRSQLTVEDGLFTKVLPKGLSRVNCKLIYDPQKLGVTVESSIEIVAGFIGVRQDEKSGTLQPEIGWAVIPGKS
jgi:hypothetical protein